MPTPTTTTSRRRSRGSDSRARCAKTTTIIPCGRRRSGRRTCVRGQNRRRLRCRAGRRVRRGARWRPQ
jgi:hypothetical protein